MVQVFVIFTGNLFQYFHLFDKTIPHIRCQIKIKSRNRLSAMHFILSRLERNATEDASRLDPFCRTGFTMTDIESRFSGSYPRDAVRR